MKNGHHCALTVVGGFACKKHQAEPEECQCSNLSWLLSVVQWLLFGSVHAVGDVVVQWK